MTWTRRGKLPLTATVLEVLAEKVSARFTSIGNTRATREDLQSDTTACLAELRELREAVEVYEREAVAVAREEGVSWERIGTALGIARQSAQERFGGKR